MVLSQSNIPAADYIINRDPWLRRLGGRQAGKRISESMFEAVPPVLRGRPTYDRLPGQAEAYNKESNNYLSRGTIILPEAHTVISSAEDLYFRDKFPELYQERDYVTGSYYGAGSGAALFDESLVPVSSGQNISGRNILFRSAILFWPRDAVRDNTQLSSQTVNFPGGIVQLPQNGNGWFWVDGNGNLNVSEGLPDGIANLTGNIWCDPNAIPELGQRSCVQRVIFFERDSIYRDFLDVGLTDDEVNWPPVPDAEANYATEVSPLFRFSTVDGVLTLWEDFRSFNRTFDPPIARWLLDYWDNFHQETRETIDTFVDDRLNPDSIGLNYIPTNSSLRSRYKPETLDKILEAWDFGLITLEERFTGLFSFLETSDLDELEEYDFFTNAWLDWLAQHFGFQDNGSPNRNYWHNGSFYENVLRPNEVYYTIAEKRTILRNALSQDQFQEYVDVGDFSFIEPVWNDFEDFWNLSAAIWDQQLPVPANKFEFRFTRFPFNLYNRIFPSQWYGLQRAKGTIKGLEFMYDTLGLHGYVCFTNDVRTYDEPLDFQSPLIPFKFTNSVLVEKRKELNENNEIIPVTTPPLFNTQGYESTGIVKTGETIFMKDYENKVVVRAPFSWARDSQKWNRLQEINNTYAREGSVVSGYYMYRIGQSAAGEPVWIPEECTACRYNVGVSPTDNYVAGDFSTNYIQNMTSQNVWEEIGIDRSLNDLDGTTPLNFNYIDDGSIIVGLDVNGVSQDNLSYNFPVLVSRDNGKSYEFVEYGLPYEFSFVQKIRVYGEYIYVLDFNTIVYSQDTANSWKFLAQETSFDSEIILDVFHDLTARRIYVLTSDSLYFKFDNNNTWTKIHDHDFEGAEMPGPLIEIGEIIRRDTALYIYLYDTNSQRTLIHQILLEGGNSFLIYSSLTGSTLASQLSPKVKYTANNNYDGTGTYHTFLFSPYNVNNEWELVVQRIPNGEFEKLEILPEILNYLSEEFEIASNEIFTEITDIDFNYKTSRWDLLVTVLHENFFLEGIILSYSNDFSNLRIEAKGLSLPYNPGNIEFITTDFLNKNPRLQDVDAAVMDQPIDFLPANETLNLITFDNSVTIDPSSFASGYNFVNWSLPRIRSGFSFVVNSDGTIDITENTADKTLTIKAELVSLTDKKSLFFKLQST